MSKPFFTAEDFNDYTLGISPSWTADTANAKIAPLLDELEKLRGENEKFREHFENCKADKIVTLTLENTRLRSALELSLDTTLELLPYALVTHRDRLETQYGEAHAIWSALLKEKP